MKFKNKKLEGTKINRLKLISLAYRNDKGRPYYNCECDCGAKVVKDVYNIFHRSQACSRACPTNKKFKIGQKFRKLTIIDIIGKDYIYKCECGNTIKNQSPLRIRSGSCGCGRKNLKQPKSLIGRRFGKLKVTKLAGFPKIPNNRMPIWQCLCDCGNEKNIWHYNLLRRFSQSCGCLRNKYNFISCSPNYTNLNLEKNYKVFGEVK